VALRPQWQMVFSSIRLSAKASSARAAGTAGLKIRAQAVAKHRDAQLVAISSAVPPAGG